MIGPNYFVYIAGGIQRDDAKVRALAAALKLSLYDAKVMLGAPGPRKVGAFMKEEEAGELILALREAGMLAFLIDKEKFSRQPALLQAVKAVEQEMGLVFTIERFPEMSLPKGSVQAVILGYYTQAVTHTTNLGRRLQSVSNTNLIRNSFIHLYSDDVHTILDIRGPKFELAWLDGMRMLPADARWQKLAERFAAYYKAKLDTTLFRYPDEVNPVTAALNVTSSHGQAGYGAVTSSSSIDDTPVALAASRIIVYSLVYGL